MHTDEDEEEMYKEEELKRLHAAGYGQVGFNYDAPADPQPTTPATENDVPFVAPPSLVALLPEDIVLPDGEKLNAIIEKTAKFIATQGAQMEILLRAKQADNSQFQFLSKESPLHAYYVALTALVKSGKWPERVHEEAVEEKHPENEEYLHPSLGSTMAIESAPSIPSIPYRPSADCDYSLLISRMRDRSDGFDPASGELPPPGTEPTALPTGTAGTGMDGSVNAAAQDQATQAYYQQYMAYYYPGSVAIPPPAPAVAPALAPTVAPAVPSVPPPVAPTLAPTVAPIKSSALSLMNNYNTDSESDNDDIDDTSSTDSKDKEPPIKTPPDDIQLVIDKMAAYVARNGDEFAEIVRAKNDPRFMFLEPSNEYHPWYLRLMRQKRGVENGGKEKKKESKSKSIAPVSFSIKKLKEPDPVLPKPALPYESSSDEESEPKPAETKPETTPDNKLPTTTNTKVPQPSSVPPAVVYKIEQANPIVINNTDKSTDNKTTIEKTDAKDVTNVEVKTVTEKPAPTKVEQKERVKAKSQSPEVKEDRVKYDKKEKKYKERREHRSMSRSRDDRSPEKERRRQREKERVKRKRKYSRDDLESEIISLEENNDELIDLTEDLSDAKEVDTEADKAKQAERRRRAAEFLRRAGVDPAAAALPASSLASAMVDTLESIRKKKAEEEEKRRKREKKRHRSNHNGDREERSHKKRRRRKYEDEDDDTDRESSKKKKRKKDKKSTSKSKKKKRKEAETEPEEEEEDYPLASDIDLTTTLKGLRTSSPTRNLIVAEETNDSAPSKNQSSESEDEEEIRVAKKRKKKEREYSEGEWSSDSEEDSTTGEEDSG